MSSTRIREAAEAQVVLEGVRLPAGKDDLVRYAMHEDPAVAHRLDALPQRQYRTLDEVGEALTGVQPPHAPKAPPLPRAESGRPPGGDEYLRAFPQPGAVRDDAPPSNPPQQALEQQSKTKHEQQERRKQLG